MFFQAVLIPLRSQSLMLGFGEIYKSLFRDIFFILKDNKFLFLFPNP